MKILEKVLCWIMIIGLVIMGLYFLMPIIEYVAGLTCLRFATIMFLECIN